MRLGIIGFGRLGQSLAKELEDEGHTLAFASSKPLDTHALAVLDSCHLIFILVPAHALLDVANKIAPLRVPTVIGTTGWEEDQANVLDTFASHDTPMLYGSNFCPAIFLMRKSLEFFLKTSAEVGERFRLTGFERHHKYKLDSPSGTAKVLHSHLASYSSEEMPAFSFDREGEERGYHEVTMENKGNVLSWSHKAKDRSIFAKGALKAGLWLVDRQGIHTFEAYMETLL